jgi:hypothetical protein
MTWAITLAEGRGTRRVDRHDEVPLVCKYVRVPPCRPAIIPGTLGTLNALQDGPLNT